MRKLILLIKTVLVILLLNVLCNTTKADQDPPSADMSIQSKLGINNIVLPAPTAATFARYGDYPVDKAFGIPNINIPIYNIASGNVSLPLSISYHGGGNKISDPGGWIGLGWNLSAGGVITRVMNGKPDEKTGSGYLNISKTWFLDGVTMDDYDWLTGIGETNSWDTQPDIFSYNFPGYSGKFMFDENGDVKLIPYQPIEITPTIGSGDITEFTIVLPDGTEYLFNEGEYTETYAGWFSDEAYYSAWHLTSISDPVSGDAITITYDTYDGPEFYYLPRIYSMTYKQITYGNYNLVEDHSDDGEVYYDHLDISEKRINRITFANGKLEFTGGYKSLDKIEVFDNDNELISLIDFTITAFTDGADCSGNLCSRMKLAQLQIDDKTWDFSYNETIPEPPLNTMDKDHWGYYNGAGNSTLVPAVNLYGTVYGSDADRNTDPTNIMFGILKRITYPTGGRTDFTYEANQLSICDPRTGEIKEEFDHVSSNTLTATSPSKISQTYEWPTPYYLPISPESEASSADEPTWYTQLKITIEIGTHISNWNPSDEMYTQDPKFEISGPYVNEEEPFNETRIRNLVDPDGNYQPYGDYYIGIMTMYVNVVAGSSYTDAQIGEHSVYLSTSMANNYIKYKIERTGYTWVEPSPSEANMYVGGVRVKRIENTNADGSFASRVDYNYNKLDSDESSAVLVNGTLTQIQDNLLYYDTYGSDPYTACVCGCEHSPNELIVSDNPYNGFTSGGAAVVYNNVTELRKDKNGNNLGKTIYRYWNMKISPFGTKNYPNIPSPDDVWYMGKPVEIKVYDSDDKLMKRVSNAYGITSKGVINAISVAKNRNFDWIGWNCCMNCGLGSMYLLEQYAYNEYSINSYWRDVIKNSVDEYIYNGSTLVDTITTTTDYTYTRDFSWILPKSIEKNTSESDTLVTEYTYEQEIRTNVYPALMREEKKYIKEEGGAKKVIEAQSIDYYNNKPSRLYKWNGETPDTDFTDIYDNGSGVDIRDDDYETDPSVDIEYYQGRTVQVTSRNGIVTYYVWAYDKNYPVIKIESSNPSLAIGQMQTAVNGLSLSGSDVKTEIDTDIASLITAASSYLSDTDMVTYYTYKPLVGVTSVTNPREQTVYYTYDSFGRLEQVLDQDGNVLKEHEYNYR